MTVVPLSTRLRYFIDARPFVPASVCVLQADDAHCQKLSHKEHARLILVLQTEAAVPLIELLKKMHGKTKDPFFLVGEAVDFILDPNLTYRCIKILCPTSKEILEQMVPLFPKGVIFNEKGFRFGIVQIEICPEIPGGAFTKDALCIPLDDTLLEKNQGRLISIRGAIAPIIKACKERELQRGDESPFMIFDLLRYTLLKGFYAPYEWRCVALCLYLEHFALENIFLHLSEVMQKDTPEECNTCKIALYLTLEENDLKIDLSLEPYEILRFILQNREFHSHLRDYLFLFIRQTEQQFFLEEIVQEALVHLQPHERYDVYILLLFYQEPLFEKLHVKDKIAGWTTRPKPTVQLELQFEEMTSQECHEAERRLTILGEKSFDPLFFAIQCRLYILGEVDELTMVRLGLENDVPIEEATSLFCDLIEVARAEEKEALWKLAQEKCLWVYPRVRLAFIRIGEERILPHIDAGYDLRIYPETFLVTFLTFPKEVMTAHLPLFKAALARLPEKSHRDYFFLFAKRILREEQVHSQKTIDLMTAELDCDALYLTFANHLIHQKNHLLEVLELLKKFALYGPEELLSTSYVALVKKFFSNLSSIHPLEESHVLDAAAILDVFVHLKRKNIAFEKELYFHCIRCYIQGCLSLGQPYYKGATLLLSHIEQKLFPAEDYEPAFAQFLEKKPTGSTGIGYVQLFYNCREIGLFPHASYDFFCNLALNLQGNLPQDDWNIFIEIYVLPRLILCKDNFALHFLLLEEFKKLNKQREALCLMLKSLLLQPVLHVSIFKSVCEHLERQPFENFQMDEIMLLEFTLKTLDFFALLQKGTATQCIKQLLVRFVGGVSHHNFVTNQEDTKKICDCLSDFSTRFVPILVKDKTIDMHALTPSFTRLFVICICSPYHALVQNAAVAFFKFYPHWIDYFIECIQFYTSKKLLPIPDYDRIKVFLCFIPKVINEKIAIKTLDYFIALYGKPDVLRDFKPYAEEANNQFKTDRFTTHYKSLEMPSDAAGKAPDVAPQSC